MAQFAGKTALVTGGGRGIGRAICLELAAGGATVLVNYHRSAAAAAEVVAEIAGQGGVAHSLQADASHEAQVAELFKQARALTSGLDILVNNAGMTRDNVIMLMKPADFDAVLDTNLRSCWLCSKAAARLMMRRRSGSIVNITSVVGISGNGGQTNYAASKAGIIGLTKSLAKELASRGVRVNALAPGFVETAMTADLSPELKQSALAAIPLGRMGSPEDIAQAVAFLASDRAAYITGQTLVVDGGMVM
ncbi:MAG: 3-oxoacyl-[acyl-carrier-protein] reductase [Chloroflexi bacterium]|nr:3-oxoacyl-[acyl-carrier-protein] reductase [Chloroflexota bacterium]MCY3582015.1 3-oxoacyl-[acyl-carrier-protein] reductase [Chloroflexota bacterium]MCY3716526.1 3-oxoacyl-[acyl-carrier-protein] reductase [Chloroflexota bacterium]MDE2651635.1 3-oxoacyl-[acyl-carrier-protein] reductase [Chloroflexota bacterium]MXV92705.1 3-oxoacyl-[acyl-carrier-protein] reductase [Chloroflexota bacterium]